MGNLIEIKVPKATLFLTPEEYETALRRGKAILRAREMDKRQSTRDESKGRK